MSGFCAVSSKLPLKKHDVATEVQLAPRYSGLNATFGEQVHCVAAEPDATVVRVSVTDGGQEVAYETAMLGRLRRGFRVLQLRGPLGTRIELAYLLVKVSFGWEDNQWSTQRQQNMQLRDQTRRIAELESRLTEICDLVPELTRSTTVASRLGEGAGV